LRKLIGTRTAAPGVVGTPPEATEFALGEPVDWKRVWRLQEREDAGEAVSIAVPPPFKREDYAHPNGWKIRGKFNIANERFIVYDELTPPRYAWGGRTVSERAALSLQAFEQRDRSGDDAPETPVPPSDDQPNGPARCGIQFPLWDKIDELRRTSDPLYEDVVAVAEICGRGKVCPCDVLAHWRERTKSGRGRRAAAPARTPRAPRTTAEPAALRATAAIPETTPEQLDALRARLRPAGDVGLPLAELEMLFAGDRAATRRALDLLREEGEVEPVGRGRGVRYRTTTQARLL